MSLKAIIDEYFPECYCKNRSEKVAIQSETTEKESFDLQDKKSDYIVDFGEGNASFRNYQKFSFDVLAYDGMIHGYGYVKSLHNLSPCDFILFNESHSIIVFDEITSSKNGIVNLTKPLPDKHYSKFEKVEKQLADTITVLSKIEQVKAILDKCKVKVCLCSYRLYTGEHNAKRAFGRANTTIDRETGENGTELSCPKINDLGFKYFRISHDYAYKLS